MNIIELAQECQLIGMRPHLDGIYLEALEKFAALVEAAARADERRFLADKWEKWYGYDQHGIAEFIRKRANTQEEQT
jgi:hypothetical protein